MSISRPKLVAWLAGVSLVAIAAFAIFGREQILERWYLYQLGSEDLASVGNAAERLAAMGSTRAIDPLIEQIPKEIERGRTSTHVHGSKAYWLTDSKILKAIYDLGAESRAKAREKWGGGTSEGKFVRALEENGELRYSDDPVQLPGVSELDVD